MRSALWSGFSAAIVCAVTVGLAAQTPPSSSAPQASKQVTLSGCIEKAPSEAGASAATAPPAFILADAAPAASASGTVGTSGGRSPPRNIDWMRMRRNSPRMWVTRSEITAPLKKCQAPRTPASGATASKRGWSKSSRSIPSRWSRRPVPSASS